MSSSPLSVPLIVLMLLALQSPSVTDLLTRDEVQQAEALLDKQPKTAESVALRGEIEYRKGNFDRAQAFYKEALAMNAKTARAHYGLGKLATAKLKTKQAIQEMTRAIELDPKEPLYHFYASEAWSLEKNYTEQRKQIEEYIRLNPSDPDRLAEAKAGLDMLKALGNDVAFVDAPENPAPIPFRKSLNLIFTRVM